MILPAAAAAFVCFRDVAYSPAWLTSQSDRASLGFTTKCNRTRGVRGPVPHHPLPFSSETFQLILHYIGINYHQYEYQNHLHASVVVGILTALSLVAGWPWSSRVGGGCADPTVLPALVTKSTTAAGAALPPPSCLQPDHPAGWFRHSHLRRVAGSPRLMEIGPDGELYVALMASRAGRASAGPQHDGLSDGVEVVANGKPTPQHGMAQQLCSTWRRPTKSSGLRRQPTAIDTGFHQIDLPTGGHSSRTLHFGPDGKLYVAVGSSCNICGEHGPDTAPTNDPRRAAILRFNDDGTIPNDNPFKNDADPICSRCGPGACATAWISPGMPAARCGRITTVPTDLGDDIPPRGIDHPRARQPQPRLALLLHAHVGVELAARSGSPRHANGTCQPVSPAARTCRPSSPWWPTRPPWGWAGDRRSMAGCLPG